MKAIILAAGKGTRMLPFTIDRPKVLVEINGKPYLHYVIENVQQAGFTEIAIVVGYKKEKIKEFLAKNNIKATLIEQKEPLGTGHAVLQAQQFCGKDDFVLFGGDNLFSVQDLKTVQQKDRFCYVVGTEVEDWQKFGVLVVNHGKLIKIVEKPQQFVGNLINCALYKFTADLWPALDKIQPSERGEIELTDAVSILALEGKVKVLELKEQWIDLGCTEDIRKIKEFLIAKKKIL